VPCIRPSKAGSHLEEKWSGNCILDVLREIIIIFFISFQKGAIIRDNALILHDVTNADKGKYNCEASNLIPSGKGRQQQIVSLDRELRVKSMQFHNKYKCIFKWINNICWYTFISRFWYIFIAGVTAWILPLVIILVFILILIAIIGIYEFRKNRMEQNLLVPVDDD
jgi:hypothetical protein